MKRCIVFRSLLGMMGDGSFSAGVSGDPQRPQIQRASLVSTVPKRLRRFVEFSDANDFSLPDNGVTDMLTERLQELVASKVSSREQLIAPCEVASQLAEDEAHQQRLADGVSSASTEEAFVPYIGKALARAGCCSRKEAVQLVSQGHVRVNGRVVTDAHFVCEPSDNITISGVEGRIRFAPPRLWMYHKPRNISTSAFDPQGRKVLLAHASSLGFDHIIPVCRLSYAQHGLMLLTNDGTLGAYLEHPATQLQHIYRLRVTPSVGSMLAQRITEKGIDVDGVRYSSYEFIVDPRRSKNYVQVRARGEEIPIGDVFKSMGRTIKRGGRTAIGPFQLSTLGLGQTKEVSIPPSYFKYAGDHWSRFVERDWPFFRRKRIRTLRSMSQYRVLTQNEMEELDSLSSEETSSSNVVQQRSLKTMDKGISERPVVIVPL